MGMYTEFHYNAELLDGAPREVLDVLSYMINHKKPFYQPPTPKHSLFETDRWAYMLVSDSYYFAADTHSTLRWDDIARAWFICIRCNFKNYCGELEKFCEWIDPYVSAREGEFLGFSRYEQDESPSLIFKQSGTPSPPPGATMKERPILFSAPMVRAILDGSKTQTRRTSLRLAKEFNDRPNLDRILSQFPDQEGCPYGSPGDRLWVRETWAVQHEYDAFAPSEIGSSARWHYAATEDLGGLRKRPSILLPRRGSRITLEITGARVERLQSITEADARAEGIVDGGCLNCGNPEPCGCADPQPDARDGFAWLWQSINGSESWHSNPWVWVIEFRRIPPEAP